MKGKRGKRKGTKGEKNARRFLVHGVNLGDGEPCDAVVTVTARSITVRRRRSRSPWRLSLAEAAGIIARRAQAELCGALSAAAKPKFGTELATGEPAIRRAGA